MIYIPGDITRGMKRAFERIKIAASGIEARSDATPQSGAAEGESPTAESGDARKDQQ